MPRYFTLRQAELLLPEVGRLLDGALRAKQRYEELDGELKEVARSVFLAGGMRLDPARLGALKEERDVMADALREPLESIANLGVLIKDLDIGLVDFPTLYRGREVLLCWRLGEEGISFWHGLEEGFRGRKPIDHDFLEHHDGGESH
jgi:hypothetical protein